MGGLPIGLGFRVPCMVISPFSQGGYVSSTVFDHTSSCGCWKRVSGWRCANLSKWRRETCGDLARAFGFGHAPRFDIPKLPETEHALGWRKNAPWA